MTAPNSSHRAVSIALRDGVAVVTIDHPPVNALSLSVRNGLLAAFRGLAGKPDVTAIVVTGAGADFIAGADLREMSLPPIEPALPVVIEAMEACPQPIVAAIRGAALGGGYEFALACDLRIAAPDAVVGLPETRLGIIPGAGGTQRLPRLVGIDQAIDLITGAKRVKAAEALRLGLIDHVAENDLVDAAIRFAKAARKRRLSEAAIPPPQKAPGDAERVAPKRARSTPAIAAAIEMIRRSETLPFRQALAEERATFLRLRESGEAKAARHLFFAEREARKIPGLGDARPRRVTRAAVIGAGTMGAGIAVAFADAGYPVAVIERDEKSAVDGAARVRAIYDRQAASGRIETAVADERRERVSVGTDWAVLCNCDLVVEAVFEDMEVKRETFRRVDELAPAGTLLATNTSYLDVDAIAAATARPQDVVGLHFFSPANVMRLVEVVRGAQSSPETLVTALDVARKLGKLPIVAGVCDGFIGNRIYAVYRRHAEYLALDGAPFAEIDRAVENYGFAMGPFAVNDLTGLDISWAMRKRRAATRDPGERYVHVADRLCEAGQLGRKSGRGWYLYGDGAGKGAPNPDAIAFFHAERTERGIVARAYTEDEIVRRLLAVMANEGAKVLADGIALRASDIDLVFVNGYGFPAHRGGPMFAADERGLRAVLADMEAAAKVGGVGSEPAPLLRTLAESGGRLTGWRTPGLEI